MGTDAANLNHGVRGVVYLERPVRRLLERVAMKTPSPQEVEAAATERGGWTREQLAEWGVPWPPPKGWKAELLERWKRENREGL